MDNRKYFKYKIVELESVYYLLTKALNHRQAKTDIQTLLSLFEIAPVNRVVIEQAIKLKFTDFEDAVLHEAARHAGAAYNNYQK